MLVCAIDAAHALRVRVQALTEALESTGHCPGCDGDHAPNGPDIRALLTKLDDDDDRRLGMTESRCRQLAPGPRRSTETTVPELPEGWEWADLGSGRQAETSVRAETAERADYGEVMEEGFFHAYMTDEGHRFYGERAPVPVVLAVLARAGLLPTEPHE